MRAYPDGMADGSSNKELSHETAEALLTAIKNAAPNANERGTDSLEHLANAYAAVAGATPRAPGKARGL